VLAQRADEAITVTRRQVGRLLVAGLALVLVLSAVLALDFLPQGPAAYVVGDLVGEDIRAPRALDFTRDVLT
jgi:hypothetical protein